MRTILIVDDHAAICSILSDYISKGGFRPLVAHTGEEALSLFRSESPDLVLLDVMLPAMDGIEVLKRLRMLSDVPVLMISAKTEECDRIRGLDEGADDYIIKPFSPGEVMARVRAILRRIAREDETKTQVFRYESLTVNLDEYSTEIGGTRIPLTKKETELLWTLATNNSKVFSRDNLLNSLWGFDYYGDTRTVDSHIKRLRAKLDEAPHNGWEIKTIWGVGYKFEVTL